MVIKAMKVKSSEVSKRQASEKEMNVNKAPVLKLVPQVK
jgi:hypothetical protein